MEVGVGQGKPPVPPVSQVQFGRAEMVELREIFDLYDRNHDGVLDSHEIKHMLMSLGTAENLNYDQVCMVCIYARSGRMSK